MEQKTENIMAALQRRECHGLLEGDRAGLVEEVLVALGSCGFVVVKPAALRTDAPAQIKSCLRVAHYEIAGGNKDLAQQKIEVALCLIQNIEDYLRELERMGTQVPVTWAEWMQEEYRKRFAKSEASGNVKSPRSTKNEIGISAPGAVPAEGF